MKKKLKHPGRVLFEDYLSPLDICPADMVKATGLGQRHLYNLQAGSNRINSKVALAVERWTGIPARHLLELQMNYDLQEAGAEFATKLRKIKPRPDRRKLAGVWR